MRAPFCFHPKFPKKEVNPVTPIEILDDVAIAELLNISRRKSRSLWRLPDFPGKRIGRRLVVAKDAFEQWLHSVDTNKEQPPGPTHRVGK